MSTIAWSSPAPGRDHGGLGSLRLTIVIGAVALMIFGATGATAHALFHQPSTLKYAITVLGPAFIAVVTMSAQPLRLLICLAIVVTPIDFVATLQGIQVTPQVALIVLCLPLVAANWRGRSAGWLGPAMVGMALLLIPAIAAGTQALSYVIWLTVTVVMGWLAFRLASEPGGVRLVLLSLTAAAFVQGLIAVYEYKSGHTLNLYNSSGVQAVSQNYFYNYGTATRPSGTLPDPISLGNVLSMVLPLMICLTAMDLRRWVKVAIGLAGAVATLGLILSYSRLSWVAAAVSVPLCLLLLPPGKRLKTTVAVAGVAVVIIAAGASIGGSELTTRFKSLFNPTNTQSSYRGTAKTDQLRERDWTAAEAIFREKPLGTGFGNLVSTLADKGVEVGPGGDAQDFYLQIMDQAGVLGALALILLFGGTFRDLWVGFRRNRVFIAGAVGAVVAVMIGWSTDVSARSTQVSGAIAALLGAVAATAAARRENSEPDGSAMFGARVVLATPVSDAVPLARRWWPRRALPTQNGGDAHGEVLPPAAPTLILAEGETSFADALTRLGIPFLTRPIDDNAYEPDGPIATVRRNALRRALAAARPGETEAVLGIDRRLMAGMRAVRLPEDADDARETLELLSGGVHHVISAVALVWSGGVRTAVSATAVTLRDLTPELVDAYLASGEWVGHLGAYDIEGTGASLVQRIEGDYQNLTGVPLDALLDVYPAILD